MKATRLSISLLVLLASGAVTTAQSADKKPAQAPAHQKEPAAHPKEQAPHAKEAGLSGYEPGTQLHFTVTGLSAENSAKVKDALSALSSQTYVCDKCKFQQSAPGKCTSCNVDLTAHKEAFFQSVVPSVQDSSLELMLDPSTAVRYSDIESTLMKNSIKLDPAHFPIAGKARLILRGAKAEDAMTIEKALKDAKLFDDVKVNADAAGGDTVVVVRAGAAAPTKAKVTSALEAAGVKATLSDVVWGRAQGMMPKKT